MKNDEKSQRSTRGVPAGQAVPELTKFKRRWRTLPVAEQEFWQTRFLSGEFTHADNRQLIRERLEINLELDNQGTAIKRFFEDEMARQEAADRQEANQQRILAEHPDWTMDDVRAEVINTAYYETLASGNIKLGMAIVRLDANLKRVEQGERKMDLLEKRADEKNSKIQNSNSGETPIFKFQKPPTT